MYKGIFLLFILFFSFLQFVGGAGISPPTYTVGFIPNQQQVLYFSVSGYENVSLGQINCPEWLTYNNDASYLDNGRIGFSVTLKYPSEIKTPGEHRCGFIVEEYRDPNIPDNWAGIRAVTRVGGLIIVNVPYPKKYATLNLDMPSANKGELIYASVTIKNFGIEDIENIRAKIDFLDLENKTIDTLETTSAERISPHQTVKLWKKIDTSLYEAAKYKAIATFDYGGDETARDEKFFFVGKPYIEFLKASENATSAKLNNYYIEVESWWGDILPNVYASVNVYNQSFNREFKTINIDLAPWTIGTLEGYFDATGFSPGLYNVEIKIKYYGIEETIKQTNLAIYEEEKVRRKIPLFQVITVGLLIVILLVNLGWFIFKKVKLKYKKRIQKEEKA